MVSASVQISDVFRALVIAEIFFSIGWLIARVINRKHPMKYLSLMAVALVIYSAFAAFELAADRWGKPLSWQAPFIFVAATVSFIAIVREGLYHGTEREDTDG